MLNRLEFILILIALILLIIWQLSIDVVILGTSLFAILLYGRRNWIIKERIKQVLKDIKDKKLHTILVITFFSLLLVWKLNILIIVFVCIFLSFMFYNWDSRFLIGVGLALLAIIPIVLVFRKAMFAEIMTISRKEFPIEVIAVYAYYFLIIAVVLQIVEYWKESKI